MKHMTKRLLSIVMVLTLSCSLAIPAIAEETDVKEPEEIEICAEEIDEEYGIMLLDDSEWITLTDGGEMSSGYYRLKSDVKMTVDITIPSDAEVTIDLNGHALKGTGTASAITNYGTFTLEDSSGNAVISGNTGSTSTYISGGIYEYEDVPSDVYIDLSKTTNYPTRSYIQLSGPLTEGASIGVTTSIEPTEGNPVQITIAESDTNYYASSAQYFFSDEGYSVQANESGKYVEVQYSAKSSTLNGVCKASDGNWYYYVDGVKQTSYTGFASNSNGDWYIENGKVTFNTNSVIKDTTGAIGTKGTWYIVNGKVDFSFNGTVTDGGKKYTVKGGKVV